MAAQPVAAAVAVAAAKPALERKKGPATAVVGLFLLHLFYCTWALQQRPIARQHRGMGAVARL